MASPCGRASLRNAADGLYNVPAMCRASIAMYNTHEEVDRPVTGLKRIHHLLELTGGVMAALPDKEKVVA